MRTQAFPELGGDARNLQQPGAGVTKLYLLVIDAAKNKLNGCPNCVFFLLIQWPVP